MDNDKGISVGVGGGGVNVNVPGGTNVNVGHPGGGGGVHVDAPGGTNVNVGPGSRGTGGNKPGGTNVNVGHPGGDGGVHVDTPGGTNVNVGPGSGGAGGNKPGGTNANVGKGGGGVGVTVPGGTSVNVGKGGGGVGVKAPEGTDVNVGKGDGGVDVNAPGGTNVNVPKGGGVTVDTRHHHKGKSVSVGVVPGASPFLYNYAATKDQLHDNPNVALFFLENNMTRGSTMNLHFFKTSDGSHFLPRQVAESIPFSSNKLGDIFNRFSVKPQSQEAQMIKNTIKECELPGVQGEEKFCATSLEAMVDFSTSKLVYGTLLFL